jgi:hypothetical protein
MKMKKQDKSDMDLGFQLPPTGEYNWQITDGIAFKVNAETGSKGYTFPVQITEVVSGDAEALMMKANQYVNIMDSKVNINTRGVAQVGKILALNEKFDAFMKKFGTPDGSGDYEIDLLDQKVQDAIKTKFPGMSFFCSVKNDGKNFNWGTLGAVRHGKAGAPVAATDDDDL